MLDAQLLKENFEQLGATYINRAVYRQYALAVFRQYVEAFQGCLDQTTPLSYGYIEQVLRDELKKTAKTLEDIFAHIEKSPLASASIAQVHGNAKIGRKCGAKSAKTQCGNRYQYRFGCAIWRE